MKNQNTHLTRLKGKIIRDEECPLKKTILCEECEFYDGWGIDIENHRADVFCSNPNILKGKELTLTPITCRDCKRYPCTPGYCENYEMFKPKKSKKRKFRRSKK